MAEKRLIDADKRIAEIKNQYCTDCNNYGGVRCRACWVDDAICLIDEYETVDAVEVVRCWECKHCDPENHHCDHHMGTATPLRRKPDDFCSYGERKDGDENGKA